MVTGGYDPTSPGIITDGKREKKRFVQAWRCWKVQDKHKLKSKRVFVVETNVKI